jgi:flagellar basal body P-ring protein FlgI
MMDVRSVKIPKEVAQLLSSGLVRGIEYAGDSVIVTLSTKEFFHRVLENSGIELVDVNAEKIVLKIPLTFMGE